MQLRVTIPADTLTPHPTTRPSSLSSVVPSLVRPAPGPNPVYIGDDTSSSGTRLLVYLTDAAPRSATTTTNVAPALLPARVL